MNFTFDLYGIWYMLVGVLFAGYAVLDGFDLGVGALHLFTKSDHDRRLMFNAIGPVWDGNEVWLITGGGALFAAFPDVYATVFSGFYLAFILLLVTLIFRAVAIEFRSKQSMVWWRRFWDIGFSAGSVLSALLIGVALGNIARGVPLDEAGEFMGSFWTLLNPYAVLVGLTTVALFAMHGAIYIIMKTEGELHDMMRRFARRGIGVFSTLYLLTTVVTIVFLPHMTANMINSPWLFVVPVINILAIANIYRELKRGKDFRAFVSSAVTMVALMAVFGIGMFPNLVLSRPDVANSLTAFNAASSPKTLEIMLIIAVIGMPLVIAYTAVIYRVFRGKVRLDSHSY
jgi:cytochrome d ubiquinol oxidase subunit II